MAASGASVVPVPRAPFVSTAALAAAALPQILSESPWPPAAAFDWSPRTLARDVPTLSRVRTMPMEQAVFWNPKSTHALEHNARYYVNASRHASMDEVDGTVDGLELQMSPEAFFAPPPGMVHYTSLGRLENIDGVYSAQLGRTGVLADIAAEPGAPPRLSVWMGTAGAVTQLHHDTDNNFYAQLHGEKTFLLYPPSASHEAVYVHPRLHPLAHLPLPRAPSAAEAARGSVYPPYASTGAPAPQRATLRRGDVLYIPAFWGHLATCEHECISGNVWWPPGRVKRPRWHSHAPRSPFPIGTSGSNLCTPHSGGATAPLGVRPAARVPPSTRGNAAESPHAG